ncbi:hypothetical protein A2U01_0042043, partial [Trifolium medium]|nr:hypothetical protein [Trifolium medium]
MPDEILVLPSDLSDEFAAIKAKIGNALDKLEIYYQKKLKRSLSANIEKLVQSIERAYVKRITNSPHLDQEDLVVLNFIERALVKELEVSDKINGSISGKSEEPDIMQSTLVELSLESVDRQKSELVTVDSLKELKEELRISERSASYSGSSSENYVRRS